MQPSWTRIGESAHQTPSPPPRKGAKRSCPSFRKARKAEAEHGLSFPAAAELWLHPELRVSSSIQDPVLTARVPRNFWGCLAAVPQVARGQKETVGPSPKKEKGRPPR